MNIDDIIDHLVALGGVLVLRPKPGDGSPPISYGDVFFYYAPQGEIPRTQPFATIVTKDYPGEPSSGLNRPGAFRLNLAASSAEFGEVGCDPRQPTAPERELSVPDVWFPHPMYGRAGWLSVVNPAERTEENALRLLVAAHYAARVRSQRRRTGPHCG